jgi:prepilin-type N-terminal cleavage/methylation domain-containing protein
MNRSTHSAHVNKLSDGSGNGRILFHSETHIGTVGNYSTGVSRDLSSRKKMHKGFSLIECTLAVVVIGILAVISVGKLTGARDAATTVLCLADMESFASEVDALVPSTGPPLTQEQVGDHIDWAGKYKNYWYLPNNSDFNSGHGNDLDGCDEENPGQSSKNRTCIPMRFVIICRHTTHGNYSDAKYCFKVDGMPPQIVAYDEVRHTYLQDAQWWVGEDPKFDKWIGVTPKK